MDQRRQVSDERRWDAVRQFYIPRKATDVVTDHAALYDYAARQLGPDLAIDYLEFGVAHGASIKAICERFRNPRSHFIGFDSFQGLPEAWLMHERGAFSTGGRLPHFGDNRVEFVAGWFQNTVPDRLKLFGTPSGTVFVHFDADIYASTLFLLTTLWHYIPEYYFMMDDFIHEDVVALHDFSRAYPVEVEFFAQTRGGGGNPDQVFGRLRRVSFELKD